LHETDELFAAAGDDTDSNSHLYKVSKTNGAILDLGDLRGENFIDEADAISFEPGTGNLWGWSQCEDLFVVNKNVIPSSGIPIKKCENKLQVPAIEAKLVFPYDVEIEDIEWNDDGSVLYAVENVHPKPCNQIYPPAPNALRDPEVDIHGDDEDLWPFDFFDYDFHEVVRLWAYYKVTGTVKELCSRNLTPTIIDMFEKAAEVEGLETLPKEPNQDYDTLVLGFHGPSEVRYLMVKTPLTPPVTLTECDITVIEDKIPSPNDIEGLAYSPNDKPKP
jgi:hypothetical protein